jgi:hypothetical protein
MEQTPQYRTYILSTYRDHVIATLGWKIPVVSSADGLRGLAQRCAAPPFEAEIGWRTDPPFPGALEPPEQTPNGWRMICASRVYNRDDVELGVIFMTLYGGRTTSVFVNGPGSLIPETWKPLAPS